MPVVRARGVGFAYPGGPPVLAGVDLDVEAGELIAIAGPNGGGKTTLIRLLVGLERPTEGVIELFGAQVRPGKGDRRVGYLPQRAEAALSAPITVRELVTVGRSSIGGVLRVLDHGDTAVVERAIERVGLGDLAERPLTALSGGQRQRAFIAKALAGEPQLLILDEPSAGVDADAQASLAELVEELRRDLDVTVLFISHEFGVIEPYTHRLVVVRGGIEFDGPPTELSASWHDPSHAHP
jgi:zinc transport system ATP-binding protein